jgi:hypothetical protein
MGGTIFIQPDAGAAHETAVFSRRAAVTLEGMRQVSSASFRYGLCKTLIADNFSVFRGASFSPWTLPNRWFGIDQPKAGRHW